MAHIIHAQVLPMDTVGTFCHRQNIRRAELFHDNRSLWSRLALAEGGMLSAHLTEGEWLQVPTEPRLLADEVDSEDEIFTLQEWDRLLEEFPILSIIQRAYEDGTTEEQLMSSLSQEGLIAISTVCAVASAFIGKIASARLTPMGGAALGAFLSGCCALLGKVIPVDAPAPAPGQPHTCKDPSSVYYPEVGFCGHKDAFRSCRDRLGFLDLEGNCILCPLGQSYDEGTRSCQEGCPPDHPFYPGLGCALPTTGQRCTMPNGQKGVVFLQGNECTPDGCPEGKIWDFRTEQCVEEGSQTRPRERASGEKKDGSWSTTAKVVAGVAAAGLLIGGVWWFGKESTDGVRG